jgi:protoporphyrinogen oxidase
MSNAGTTDGHGLPIIIVGAGPAGLTAAWELLKTGRSSIVLEKDNTVGGLARTVRHNGYRFDIGGHRFFTRVHAVTRLWREILGDEFRVRPRLSRIFYKGRYFDYPLQIRNTVAGLGVMHSFRAILSYLGARLKRKSPEVSLEDWIINRFGLVLYETFFKTYTEKVWGIPCAQIGADWGEQRIRGLSLYRAVMSALFPVYARKFKTLTDTFYYPRLGPGQMWETMQSRLDAAGSPVQKDSDVVVIRHQGERIVEVSVNRGGEIVHFPTPELISSMPLRELIEKMDPLPPPPVLEAARALRYRDFLTVALIINKAGLFADNWIYIHEPGVRVGRIQNFGNWSADLVPKPGTSCLGLEYFCFEGDELWSMNDADLVNLARKEISTLRLAPAEAVREGVVVRMKKAYPVYDSGYAKRLQIVRAYLDSFLNLHPIGRNGLHKYNNQDHSMFTAMLAVRSILGDKHDMWSVNTDCEYHENLECSDIRVQSGTQRQPNGKRIA